MKIKDIDKIIKENSELYIKSPTFNMIIKFFICSGNEIEDEKILNLIISLIKEKELLVDKLTKYVIRYGDLNE